MTEKIPDGSNLSSIYRVVFYLIGQDRTVIDARDEYIIGMDVADVVANLNGTFLGTEHNHTDDNGVYEHITIEYVTVESCEFVGKICGITDKAMDFLTGASNE